jgi:hypothetical protein
MPLFLNAAKSRYNVGELRIDYVQLGFAELVQKLQWDLISLGVLLPFKEGKKLMLRDRIRFPHILNLQTTCHKEKISRLTCNKLSPNLTSWM